MRHLTEAPHKIGKTTAKIGKLKMSNKNAQGTENEHTHRPAQQDTFQKIKTISYILEMAIQF